MKNPIIFSIALSLMGLTAHASLLEDFDSLGGNKVLLQKAQALQPDTKVEIVQNRIVQRENRHEFSQDFTTVMGGHSYLTTNTVGFSYNYHITPRWSVGVKYGYAFNELTKEGHGVIEKFDELSRDETTEIAYIPELDWLKQSYIAQVNWYPMYGKVNVLDRGIVHFDLYMLAGAGQVELRSGTTGTWTAGGGIGMWFSQHITSRFEMRYQNYSAQSYTGAKPLDLTMASLTLGYML